MMNQIDAFLNLKNVFAVIGVSRNPNKFGYIIYQDLKRKGYKVYAINPNATTINGQEPRPEGTGLGMVVLMQVLTRLSFNHRLELPVSGYKNVGMHTLVPTASVEPLNTTLTIFVWDMPDMACRRVLNSCTGGLYHDSV